MQMKYPISCDTSVSMVVPTMQQLSLGTPKICETPGIPNVKKAFKIDNTKQITVYKTKELDIKTR